MNFESWIKSIGKSERTAENYSRAVTGVMSDWARDAGLIVGSLSDMHSAKELSAVVVNLEKIEIFQARNTKGKNMYSCALKAFSDYLTDQNAEDVQEDIEEILNDSTIGETEKSRLINSRVGQGKYRRQLIDQWQSCSVTGFSDIRFLVASHIKPWKYANNQERLDPFNGLLLLPNLDKAFDLGFISFKDRGEILISQELDKPGVLGIDSAMKVSLSKQHQDYMQYHRDIRFKS